MPQLLIEHRRSTRHQGVTQLSLLAVLLLILGAVAWLFGPAFWRFNAKGIVAWCAITIALAVATVVIPSIVGIVRNREFVCRLTSESLECQCPGWGNGQTCNVRVADIVKIQYKGSRDDNMGREIFDRAGNVYWLTRNFGNPVRTIVTTLCELNKAIELDEG